MSVRLWKVLIPALSLAVIYTACKKDQSATSENNNITEPNVKLSGVTPDDPAKLATLPVVMSFQYSRQMATNARKSKPTAPTSPTSPTDTTGGTGSTGGTTVISSPTLPSSYQLVTPTPGSQGSEGSCVAWATATARSIEYYYKSGATSYSYATNMFSPEFIFNQIEVGSCSASAMGDAYYLLVNKGVCTWQTMPYSSSNGCTTQPSNSQYIEAASYKISSYSLVYSYDTTAIKTLLAANHPLATTVVIDNNFYNAYPGYIWNSMGSMITSHAITIVGYDDAKHAFKAINSWGTGWADGGFIWIDYSFFGTVSNTLYLINP